MRFNQRVMEKQKSDGKHVCVGLDSDKSKLPSGIWRSEFPQFAFNHDIINATKNIAGFYKPNFAFYLGAGINGMRALEETVLYIRKQTDAIIILDAKWGDIDNTNLGYVDYAFHQLGVDAITIAPFMGGTANMTFLSDSEKGAFALCATSNKGAEEFQSDERGQESGMYLYEKIALNVENGWNIYGNCNLVTGATQPEDTIVRIREIVGDDINLLVPGIGAQGGDLEKSVRAAANSEGVGFIINSSRGIIFASSGGDFAEAAGREALKLDEEIRRCKRRLLTAY